MSVAIIGGGLSGLLCAFLLEKKGYKPTIYERLPKTGGVIDSFMRKKVMIDVGFHYSGSLSSNQFLYKEFQKYGLIDKFELLEYDEIFDTLYFGDEKFDIPNGSLKFKEKLQEKFPKEKENLELFFKSCYEVGEISLDISDFSMSIDSRSLNVVLKDIENELLKKILLHFTVFYADTQYGEASFEIYAKIMINMLDGTRKIKGNGRAIVDVLMKELKNTSIQTRNEINEIIYTDAGIEGIKIKDAFYKYDTVISTLHPRTTMSLLNTKSKKLQRYVKHINDLSESPTFFSIYCLVDKQIKTNLYFYGDECIFALPSSTHNGKTVLTVIARSSYEKYQNLEKKEYKRAKQQECKLHISRLKELYDFGNIEVIDCSTPTTKQHFSNGYKGSAYGVLCSAKQKSLSMLMPKSRIKNLYLAGESAFAPGLLGCYLGAQKVMNYYEDIK